MPPAPGKHRIPSLTRGGATPQQKPSGGWKDRQGTRQERGYGADWQAVRSAVIARDMGLCKPCYRAGRVTPFDAVDHIVPKSEGGENTVENAECVCRACHKRKTAREAAAGRRRAMQRAHG